MHLLKLINAQLHTFIHVKCRLLFAFTPLQVRFARPESEQARQRRIQSYEFLQRKQAEEPWVHLHYHGVKVGVPSSFGVFLLSVTICVLNLKYQSIPSADLIHQWHTGGLSLGSVQSASLISEIFCWFSIQKCLFLTWDGVKCTECAATVAMLSLGFVSLVTVELFQFRMAVLNMKDSTCSAKQWTPQRTQNWSKLPSKYEEMTFTYVVFI